jgi:hypothetical protein
MSSDEEENEDGGEVEEEVSAAVVDDEDEDDEEIIVAASVEDEDEVMTVKSEFTYDDDESKRAKGVVKRKRGGPPPGSRKGRTPAVQGLSIPFRAIKRTMKMDSDIGTVQNEAAIIDYNGSGTLRQEIGKPESSNCKGQRSQYYTLRRRCRSKN